MFNFGKNRLFRKIFWLLFFGITFVIVVFGFVGASIQKRSILELLHSEAKSLAQTITFSTTNALITEDSSYLIEFNTQYLQNNTKVKNLIIAKSSEQYFDIKKDLWSFDNKISDVFKKMQKREDVFDIIYSPNLKENVFHYTYPMKFSGIQWGWLHLSFDLKEYNQKIDSLYKQFFVLFIALVLLSFVISNYVAKKFTDPIIKLNETVSAITSENLDIKVDVESNDEIGELSSAFNDMISQLNISQKRLKNSHENLEKRVNERTSELSHANERLSEKSNELSELNKNLDTKVKVEIEKRREQEQMLLHQSRLAAMGEMVGNIAHQWRQPLNALGIIIQNIQLSYKMNKLDEEFLSKSVNDSMDLTLMMSKTIDDFRNFFLPNKHEEFFFLDNSLNSSLELIDSTFKNYNIKVFVDIDKKLESKGFPNEFAQAILNVLSNAKDALIEKQIQEPKISVLLKKNKDMGIIVISDNAMGIDEAVIPKIFEPYFTTKEQGKGTGIGLYMSKMIIEQNMKGRIFARNIKDGVEFVIEMPLYLKNS